MQILNELIPHLGSEEMTAALARKGHSQVPGPTLEPVQGGPQKTSDQNSRVKVHPSENPIFISRQQFFHWGYNSYK